ncbi:DNA repair protein RAD50 [Chlorella vulgaris]
MGCNIDKMLIKGIRSFSPDNQNVIEFYKPLTLIVGHNGAGKTTVIECLKMACTGELPPNTRSGQLFIHDPKASLLRQVAGETEVKAQIKLRFMTATKQPVVIIRSFQLSQKKNTLQFKALDNVLQTMNRETGVKEALSYRCADIDKMVPQLMGVSKAVLENVIFVHQEDSNWPLAEGQVLKKKFDDIFAATKYTKALEALRKLRTEKTQEVRELKLKLDNTRTLRDQAQRLRNEIEQGTERAEQLQGEVDELEAQGQAADNRRAELGRQLASIADFADDLTRTQTQYEMLAKQNAEAYHRLKASYGEDDASVTVEELLEWQAGLEPNLLTNEQELRKKTREVTAAQISVQAANERYTTDVKAQGRLAAEAEAHARNTADLQRFVHQICAQAGADVPANASQAAAVAAFKARLADAAAALQAAKTSNRQVDDNLGRGVDQMTTELTALHEAQRMKRDQQQRNSNKATELQAQASGASLLTPQFAHVQFGHLIVNTSMLEGAQLAERELEASLNAKQAQLANSKYEAEARECSSKLVELSAKVFALRQERDQLATTAEGASKLRFKMQELGEKESRLETLMMAHRSKLATMLGVTQQDLPPVDQLRGKVEQVVANRRQESRGYADQLRTVQAQLSEAEGTLAATKRQLDAARQEQGRLGNQLTAGLASASGGSAPAAAAAAEDVPARVQELTRKVEADFTSDQGRIAHLQHFDKMASQFKLHAEQANSCLTCGRKFPSPADRQAFLQKQDRDLAQVPTAVASLQQKMTGVQQQLSQLRQLQPVALRHDSLLHKEIPDLQARVTMLEANRTRNQEAMEDVQGAAAAADAELTDGLKVLEALGPIAELAREIRDRRAEIERLRGDTSAAAATRTVGDVDTELEDVERFKAALELQRDEAQRRQTRLRDEVAHVRNEYQKAREESLRLTAASEKRVSLEAQIKELGALNDQLQTQIDAALRERQPLEDKKAELLREREAKRKEMAAQEGELEGRLRELHTWDTQLAAKQQAVDEYINLGKAEQLLKVNQALEALRQRQEAGEAEIRASKLQEELRELESYKAQQNEIKRQVEDMLAYHQGKRREAELAAALDRLNDAQGNVGNKAAIEAEYEQLQAQARRLRTESDKKLGALATIQDRVNACRRELEVAQYADIEEKYRQGVVELTTTGMANSDLEKYHKALEKALLSFHTSKMTDINAIVKELWQKTYRNGDIDYIQIKADQEGAAGRSYNYRVVMHTGQAELDLRGRCSAGQKVLACLIIRLALAETFCLNCGILALDEPTTNLDADNSASLADALRSIMLARRDQENFQLVVITHDEQFARLIGTREHAEFMWRITKDEQQHSLITQEDILE